MRYKLIQSDVCFDEDTHTYTLGDNRLLGITGLIHKIFSLGVYADANDYVKNFAIPKAGSRGTAIHHAIRIYDEIGIPQPVQTVVTRQGTDYELMTWDVMAELGNYIKNRDGAGFKPLANEYTVSDGKWASQIDNVYTRDNEIWLCDTKSNNLDYYPLGGYGYTDFFPDRKEALKEYLSWQLSIYAVLFERQNPGLKVAGLCCNWLRESESDFWYIERKPDHLVDLLLQTEYSFDEDGEPTYVHPNLPSLLKELPEHTESETLPMLTPDVIEYGKELLLRQAEINRLVDEYKQTVKAAMEVHSVSKYECDAFSTTTAKDSERESINTEKLKEKYPEAYADCVKKKTVKGGIRFTSKIK